MHRLAIIGASYLQMPLIDKAKEMGLETHVFAWAANDIGEYAADFFYPISIVDKELILEKCRGLGIEGICSIASDLSVKTVNYVACEMGLTGNSLKCTELSTNKHSMRDAFQQNGDPSPKSFLVETSEDVDVSIEYPIIVKPLDRSGSRGITKVTDKKQLAEAIELARNYGFVKKALIEEYVTGQEYSVECVSYAGEHVMLSVTLKYTTGEPHFIETGHLEPAPVSDVVYEKIKSTVFHALDSLDVKYGASHSEIKIDNNDNIMIIEIGSRMGGDFIGSTLVRYSSGIDFTKAVIDIAMGNKPDLSTVGTKGAAGIHYICDSSDIHTYIRLKQEHPEYIIDESVPQSISGTVIDSSSRFGYFILKASTIEEIIEYMPENEKN